MIKKTSALALALLFSLSALRAVPTDPTQETTPPATNADFSADQSVILTASESDKAIQVTKEQSITVLLPVSSHAYSFSDSSLVDVRKIPYAFTWLGAVSDKSDVDCVNMAVKKNAPIVFQGSSLNCMYSQNPIDSTSQVDTDYYPMTFYTFVFSPNAAGTTTLTFSDDVSTYTYTITVVDASSATAK